MANGDNGNGKTIDRRYDISKGLIQFSFTMIACILMFFLGLYINGIDRRVDNLEKENKVLLNKAFENEKNIASNKADYLATANAINNRLISIETLLRQK